MWDKILPRLQPLIVLSLLTAFLLNFGIPSYQDYIRFDVLIRESKLPSVPLQSPTVTVCVDPVMYSTVQHETL